jgi:hypothetical protein
MKGILKMLQPLTAPRFSGVIYGIPLSQEPKEGAYPLDEFVNVVQNWDGFECQYDGYAPHYRDQFEAVVYEKGGKLYGGFGTENHNAEQLLTKQLLGRNKSRAGDKEPIKAPYTYDPSGWQVTKDINTDRVWVLMSKNGLAQSFVNSVVQISKRLSQLG